jgi:hypothetical protein
MTGSDTIEQNFFFPSIPRAGLSSAARDALDNFPGGEGRELAV